MNKRKGQVLIELLVASISLGLVLLMIVQMGEELLIRQRAITLASYASKLLTQGYGSVSDTQIEIESYLNRFQNPDLRNAYVQVGRFRETPSSQFYDLVYVAIQPKNQKPQRVVSYR